MRIYFDTNILVAALKAEHFHHASSFAAMLTRAPFAIPIYPDEALAMIERSVVPSFHIIEVSGQSYLAAISACAVAGWKGGRIHDAVHIQAAAQAKCDLIYTFDTAHFQSLAPEWAGRIQSPPAI
jgi:predicted nucleic acid-binding protein